MAAKDGETWERLEPATTPQVHPWPAPPRDMAALSVGRAFLEENCTVVVGMILRRHDGSVIFSVYRYLFNCSDAIKTEIHALMIGMALAR